MTPRSTAVACLALACSSSGGGSSGSDEDAATAIDAAADAAAPARDAAAPDHPPGMEDGRLLGRDVSAADPPSACPRPGMGSVGYGGGEMFRVLAPNAERAFVTGDFN